MQIWIYYLKGKRNNVTSLDARRCRCIIVIIVDKCLNKKYVSNEQTVRVRDLSKKKKKTDKQ
jgi:hypothetical protein